MKKSDDSKKPRRGKPPQNPKEPDADDEDLVREAEQLVWATMAGLKEARVEFIRVAKGLAEVRDTEMYKTLGYPDLESYAREELQLSEGSLDRYLEVYDWIARNRRQWLEPKPKGFIPDMVDLADVIWIDNELSRRNLKPRTRAKLEDLREKALKADLQDKDLAAMRRLVRKRVENLTLMAEELDSLRMEMSKVEGMPDEVLWDLDSAIDALDDEIALRQDGSNLVPFPKKPAKGKKDKT